MKLPLCVLALTCFVSIGRASSFDLDVPPLTYKAAEPRADLPPLSRPSPNFFHRRSPWKIAAQTKPEERETKSSFSTMPVIAPKAGVDYHLRVVAADPAIDPTMVVPTRGKDASKK